ATSMRDPDMLTEYARQSLKRAISARYFDISDENHVITLDPAIEQLILDAVKHTETGTYLSIAPEITRKIISATEKEMLKLTSIGRMPIALTSPIVRIYYKKLTEDDLGDLVIISFNEIVSSIKLQSVGMVSIS
ncbi:MAG: FHIPEP family type III secretion protein, partial [Vallitaleaceae bacterium]|nr:FHIPEP family type III secretion protein [Vallitaleaceae bacterium]